ncbi:MAG: hypothetical protein HRT37_19655 [Alteromonadaceae bacterium]|nr:hypothetical protein [Alteromonadaceae bacterium]
MSSKAKIKKERESDPSRKRVSRYARGNVSIQRGNYVTKKEKEARKAAVLSYDFSEA